MGLFGGEKYSKGAFQEAENAYNTAVDEFSLGNFDFSAERILETKKRMKKLYEEGKTEGMAMNKEYDRLVAQAQEALKAVQDFEKEKLGMSEEK